MPKSQKKEEILSLLSQIQENPTTEEAIAILRQRRRQECDRCLKHLSK
ncbi:hypothetical protein ACE1AT_11385 [Pelatocladus sp. BLCC-F211]